MPAAAAAASSSSASLSWRTYDEEHKLSHILTEAARACVSARAANPSEFLLSRFAQVTRGDSVERLDCTPVLSPWDSEESDFQAATSAKRERRAVLTAAVGQGLRVALRLFTKTEAAVTVMWLPLVATPVSDGGTADKKNDGESVPLPALDGPAVTAALMSLLSGPLVEELRGLGVYSQRHWDAVVSRQRLDFIAQGPPATPHGLLSSPSGQAPPSTAPSSARAARASSATTAGAAEADSAAEAILTVPCTAALPTTAQFAFSLTACLAAAASLDLPLHRHLRAITAGGSGEGALPSGGSSEREAMDSASVVLPQLLLPFFGAANRNATPPAGCVFLHTLYLLPRPGPTGALTPLLLQRLVEAYRALRERYNRPPLRADGAVVLDCFENITDAVQTATDVLQAVGIVPGEEVTFGLRLLPPVVALGAAAVPGACGPPSSSSAGADAAPAATATTSSQGKKGVVAKGKKSSTGGRPAASSPADFTYGLFSGDPEVTGQQLAEYLRQQVVECGGQIALLQDTHHPADSAGRMRLQRGLRNLSCPTCSPASAEEGCAGGGVGVGVTATDAVEMGLTELGTLSSLAEAYRAVREGHGRDVLLTTSPQELQPLNAAVEVAVGLGAAYCCVGAASLANVCAALSHLCDIQTALAAKRCLEARAAFVGCGGGTGEEETAEEEEDPVPEIKRRSDKKKKKAK